MKKMEGTDKGKEISRNSDASIADNLCDSNKVVNKSVLGCKRRSDSNGENDRFSESLSIDKNTEAKNLCIRRFEAENSKNNSNPIKSTMSNVNMGVGKPCEISDIRICSNRKTFEAVTCIESESVNTSHQRSEATKSIPNTEFSTNASTNKTHDNESSGLSSLMCFPGFNLFDSDVSSAYLESLERDPEASLKFSELYMDYFRNSLSQNYSDSDFKSETSTNDAYYPRFYPLESGCALTPEEINRIEVSLKHLKTDLDYSLLEGNQNAHKVSKSTDSDSSSCYSALNFSNGEFEPCHYDLKYPESDQESQPDVRSSDEQVMRELQSLKYFHPDIPEELNTVESSIDIELCLVNEKGNSSSSHESMRNESTNIMNNDSPCNRLDTFISSKDRQKAKIFSDSSPSSHTAFTLPESYPSGLKHLNDNKESCPVKKSNLNKNALEMLRQKSKSEETSVGVKTMDIDPDTLDDIFKRIVIYHPIKKFEIPPYESSNAERTLGATSGKSVDSGTKHEKIVMKRYGLKQQPDSLEENFSNIDSDSAMVFEVTDCFSQNSSIICDALIKEYFIIAAKVNLQLVKEIKSIPTEDHELQMRRLYCLEDELGYISAKLITNRNDWVKQIKEINQNITQSRIGSRGLYHIGILRTCIQLFTILLVLSLEKQKQVEEYETDLMFYHKRTIFKLYF